MPKNKKGATRGRARAARGRSGANNGQASYYDDDELDYIPLGKSRRGLGASDSHNGFSMQAEAQNSQRPHEWGPGQKLRNVKVNFISAGDMQPAEPIEQVLEELSLEAQIPTSETSSRQSPPQFTPMEIEEEGIEESSFVIDTIGEPINIPKRYSAPVLRSSSPTPSDSSEEVILFRGRDSAGRGLRRVSPPRSNTTILFCDKIRTIDDKIDARREPDQSSAHASSALQLVQQPETSLTPQISIQDFQDVLSGKAVPSISSSDDVTGEVEIPASALFKAITPKGPSREPRCLDDPGPRKLTRLRRLREQEQAQIDDYIANMEEDELSHMRTYNQRDLGGDESDHWEETDASRSALEPKYSASKSGEWTDNMQDFDDLSTSDGVFGAVDAILSKRERSAGLQYLVVWEGQTVDDARWVPSIVLTEPEALSLIEEFEDEEKLVAEFMDADEDDSDDSGDDLAQQGDSDDEDDEADLVQRKIDRMTDEKIARLLAKQEELGMGGDELILFDDSADGEDNDLDMDFFLPPKKRHSKRVVNGPNRGTGYFPPASAMADAYDGFDVMDYGRASLQKKPKGKKSKPEFDLSDSELEAEMLETWENDRQSKAARKREREELRAQGLLGKNKSTKPDLKAKYKEGMGIGAIQEEIRVFLQNDNTTLGLPPMDKADRKTVHEIANAFNLKSKSVGQGKHRFPILYKSARSRDYDARIFNSVTARITRRFMPRLDIKGKRPARAGGGGRGGGFASGAVSYRDGDVVGASAPELGAENKGRKMLELMGWSSGTALGALNNKGIMLPVTHVVKTTKAGLG